LKKHRQHKRVELNRRSGLRVGGVVVPYWPAYYWGGNGANPQPNLDDTETTTDGAANAGDAGAGANA
jgi:hypothetical protein